MALNFVYSTSVQIISFNKKCRLFYSNQNLIFVHKNNEIIVKHILIDLSCFVYKSEDITKSTEIAQKFAQLYRM